MKPAEYAKELGISRQAVYAKIKKGILQSKNVDGKLYIVVDSSDASQMPVNPAKTPSKKTAVSTQNRNYEALLKAKDETIEVLKETVKDLKESNKEISTTLRGEIDLLKEAFHEMRTLYTHQLEQKKAKTAVETIEVLSHEETKSHPKHRDTEIVEDALWVGVKKFLKHFGAGENKEKIAKRLKKAYKKGDHRVTKVNGKLKIDLNESYEDILH